MAKIADKTNYLSLKAGGNTKFKVQVNTGREAFDSHILEVESNLLKLSFDSLSDNVTTRLLYLGENIVTIYSYSDFFEGTADISIKARSKQGEVCLSGEDCETTEDKIKVIVYRDIVYDNYQLYCVNNPSFNPDTNEWEEEFNRVIKQAVLNIESVEKRSYNNSSWDDNGNGILDLFPSIDLVPVIMLEHLRLLSSIESTFTNVPTCYTDCPPDEQEPKTMILPGTIRRNWLIMEAVSVDDSVLQLNSIKDLKDSMEIFISTWGGSPEWNIINYRDTNNNSITVKYSLSNSYPEHSVVTDCRALVKGFTIESCCWVEDLDNYRNVIHEFCHMKAVGPLSHTLEDSTNLMFPLYGNYGSYLRYRDLETDDKFGLGDLESQWQQLHTIYTE